MIDNIQFEVARNSDIQGVLALQDLYLVSNMTEEEKTSGFVTTPFTVEQIQEVIRQEGLFIAKDDNKIIGYIFAAGWDYFSQWAIFKYMIPMLPELSFKNFKLTDTNTFQYGPICIDKKYRGKGLINPFFNFMRIHIMKRFPVGVTFINKTNIPSQKAHLEKLKWAVIGDFQFNNNNYFILAYDMSQPSIEPFF
jgi:hypothetical protein